LNRGSAFEAKGDHDLAIADYGKAIEINPQDAEAYYNRGIAMLHNGNRDGAITDYTKAIEINPRFADAYVGRGIAIRRVATGNAPSPTIARQSRSTRGIQLPTSTAATSSLPRVIKTGRSPIMTRWAQCIGPHPEQGDTGTNRFGHFAGLTASLRSKQSV
jgi:tetratricopeptide (TPR) repeat protein